MCAPRAVGANPVSAVHSPPLPGLRVRNKVTFVSLSPRDDSNPLSSFLLRRRTWHDDVWSIARAIRCVDWRRCGHHATHTRVVQHAGATKLSGGGWERNANLDYGMDGFLKVGRVSRGQNTLLEFNILVSITCVSHVYPTESSNNSRM